MKAFRNQVGLTRPLDETWVTFRDGLPALASHLPGVASIREIEREDLGDGKVRVANEWHVNFPIPSTIRSLAGLSDIGWIEQNTWNVKSHVCTWTIQPFMSKHVACGGQTSFESEHGGRGTRIILEGTLELKPGVLGNANSTAQQTATRFLEAIVAGMVRKNLRAVLEAVATHRA